MRGKYVDLTLAHQEVGDELGMRTILSSKSRKMYVGSREGLKAGIVLPCISVMVGNISLTFVQLHRTSNHIQSR